ncbi:MAG: flippase [Candidatus Nanohaloarchaea archaeon]
MGEGDPLSRVGKGTVLVFGGFGAGTVLQYGLKAVMARFLGPVDYGVFIQSHAVVQAVSILSLVGLHMSVPRFMSYYRGGPGERDSVLTSLAVVLPLSLAASLALYLSADWIAAGIFGEQAVAGPLKFFAAGVPLLSLFRLLLSFIQGRENARHKVLADNLVFPGVKFTAVTALLVLGMGVEGAVIGHLAGMAVALLTALYFYRRISGFDLGSASLSVGRLLKFSWPLSVLSFLLMTFEWADVLMLGWLLDSARVGVYEVAFTVSGFLGLFLTALNYMFLPVASDLRSQDRIGEVRRLYRTSSRWIFMAALPVAAGMMLFPGEILELFFGQQYRAGATALAVLSSGYLFHAVAGPSAMVMLSAGKTKRLAAAMSVVTALNVALDLFLIPAYGIEGAAVAMTAGLLAGNTTLLLMAKKDTGILPVDRTYIRPLISIAVPASAAVLVDRVAGLSPIGTAVLGGATFLCYTLMLWISGSLREEERELIEQATGISL